MRFSQEGSDPVSQEVFVHLPYAELVERIDLLAAARISPEVYLPAHVLEQVPSSSLERTFGALQKERLPCTIHGPCLDLNAGSGDEEIRKATLARYGQAFRAARFLRPVQMVLHAGYNRWYYGDPEAGERWLEASRRSWEWALEATEGLGLTLVLENVFEHHPGILGRLLRGVNSERLRFCFDIGHCNLFSAVPPADWIAELAPFLAEIHLHDNLGQGDDHLAIGEGKIDFASLFRTLRRNGVGPHLTIEAFDEARVRRSLKALEMYRNAQEP